MQLLLRVLAFASFGILASGCGSDGSDQNYESEVLHRASIEFSCAPSDVVITPIDHQTYLAEGCGYRATYECGIPNGHDGPNPCLRAPDLEPEDASCP